MTHETLKRFPRKDLTLVPVTEVREITEPMMFGKKRLMPNVRKDYGDIETLANQIQANDGIRVPCRGFKNPADGKYYLIDGHRRFRAALHILEKDGEIIDIPMLFEKNVSEEKRILDMIICNEGKSLNPVEQAEVLHRLREEENYSEKDIISKTGFSKVYVSNLKKLHEAPEEIKGMINRDMISSTLALQTLREHKEDALDVLQGASISKQLSTGSSKINKKDIDKHEGNLNSFSALKKAIKAGKNHNVRRDKIDLFKFAEGLVEGKFHYEYLMTELFEQDTKDFKGK